MKPRAKLKLLSANKVYELLSSLNPKKPFTRSKPSINKKRIKSQQDTYLKYFNQGKKLEIKGEPCPIRPEAPKALYDNEYLKEYARWDGWRFQHKTRFNLKAK